MTPEEIQNMTLAEYRSWREENVGWEPRRLTEKEFQRMMDQMKPTPEEIEKTVAALQAKIDADNAEAERLALRKILEEEQGG